MADKQEAPEQDAKVERAKAARPEPSITLQEFARRNQSETIDGMPRSLAVLMGGFVHEESQAGRRVGKASEYRERFDSFRKRKA